MRHHVFLLALLFGLGAVAEGGRYNNRQLQAREGPVAYEDLWTAATKEMWLVRQLYDGVFTGRICVMCWAASPALQPMFSLATNKQAKATAFSPTDDTWERLAAYYCMTVQEVADAISIGPDMPASFLRTFLVPNRTVFSSDFKDGMQLTTMKFTGDPTQPYQIHTLGKTRINGTSVWVLRNASLFRIPGTKNVFEDVVISPEHMDIKAGKAVLHQVNAILRPPDNTPDIDMFEKYRAEKLRRAGLPANSTACPTNITVAMNAGPVLGPGQLAGIVVGAVAGAALLAVTLLLLVRRVHARHAHPVDSLFGLGTSGGKGGVTGENVGGVVVVGVSGGGGGGAAGPDMNDKCVVVVPPPSSSTGSRQSSSLIGTGSARLSPQGSSGGTTMASSGDTVRSSTLCTYAPVAAEAQLLGYPQQSVAQVFESPFADCLVDSSEQKLPKGSQQQQRQLQQVSASSISRSSGSSTPPISAASLLPRTGSGQASDSSGTDQLAPLPKCSLLVATQQQHVVGPQMDSSSVGLSYGGPLVPAASMPMGSINHALVIPFAELTLKELIGSGAEGKVYRGTWKHTDIAAKEYLAVEPAAGSPETSSAAARAQLSAPSEAARAHARAALAKEVHWLTTLSHPNLVRFCAVCLDPPLVVMEFYRHGSVFAMMQKAAQELINTSLNGNAVGPAQKYVEYLSFDRRLEMLHDVAAGMSYLHGRDHIHGDLRSPNLFVGADGKVKIGDFGFTKRLGCNRASLKVSRITHPRWVAPELIMDNILSRASDVYSYGIIMYELLTLRVPFDNLRKEQVVIEVIKGVRPELPADNELPPGTSCSTCLTSYIRLMRECYAHDPAQRPSFEAIARRLKAMQRWRMLISRHTTLQRAAAAARRSHSLPNLEHLRPRSLTGATAASAMGAAAVARAGSAPVMLTPKAAALLSGGPVMAAAAAQPPPLDTTPFVTAAAGRAKQQQQQQQQPKQQSQQALQLQALRRHCVSSIPEAEPAELELPCSYDYLEEGGGGAGEAGGAHHGLAAHELGRGGGHPPGRHRAAHQPAAGGAGPAVQRGRLRRGGGQAGAAGGQRPPLQVYFPFRLEGFLNMGLACATCIGDACRAASTFAPP